MRSAISLVVGLALAAGVACGGASPTSATRVGDPNATATITPIADSADWPASSPAAEGLDTTRLGDLLLRIRRGDYGRTESLLIVRNGNLAVEEYFGGATFDQQHTLQSVTKSVTSLLVGMAIQAGRVSLSDPISRFFPEYQPLRNADDRKSAQTVRDLLSMKSGFDWSENPYAGSPLQRMNDCFCDWLRFVLDWPMRETPGTRWEYVSGGPIVLAGVVGNATGQRLDQYATSELFGPLGVSGAYWSQGLPNGLPHAGGGLFMRSRDVAKLGEMVLRGGEFRGRRLINADWIRTSTTRVERGLRYFGRIVDYGYFWWLLDDRGSDIITAAGARGQYIFISPRDRMVVVVTSNDESRESAPVEFLFSHILPAVQ